LVTLTAGDVSIDGEWEAHAGICGADRLVEVYAGEPGTGAAMVLRLPQGDPVGRYAVSAADTAAPEALGARIGVQLFRDREALGLQAIDGEFDVTTFGETMSARFAVTLREVQSTLHLRYVGVLDGVTVAVFPESYCEELRFHWDPPAAAKDSLRTTTDTLRSE
jgi:hypothetical protein